MAGRRLLQITALWSLLSATGCAAWCAHHYPQQCCAPAQACCCVPCQPVGYAPAQAPSWSQPCTCPPPR